MNVLEEIIAYKKIEVERSKEQLPLDKLKKKLAKADLKSVFASFYRAITNKVSKKEIALIAEIKKASPSKGIIKKDFGHLEIAKAYKQGGACCLSVLTDKRYFQGNLNYIKEIKREVDLPILRKDFIIDSYQIYESIYSQADCILLIVGAIDENKLKELFEISCESKLDVLIEIHDEREMEIALDIGGEVPGPHLIGINNRDLKTFETNIETTKQLVSKYKRDLIGKIIVSESGIFTKEDIQSLMKDNVYAFLVGERLMREKNIEEATKKLLAKDL